jgi:transcriptional regulator with XRE-family HTH domain
MTSIEPATNGGALLLRSLNDRGLTLEKGEVQCGVSAGYFSRLLRKSRLRDLPIALRIQEEFGVPVKAWGEPVKRQATAGAKQGQDPRSKIRGGVRGGGGRTPSDRVSGVPGGRGEVGCG